MPKALIVYGGLAAHEPAPTAEIMARQLRQQDFDVILSDNVESFADPDYTRSFDLLVPHFTAATATYDQLKGLFEAVAAGVGLAGVHGGGAASFPGIRALNHLIGGLFVCHPGGAETPYTVHIDDLDHPITRGLADFDVTSEQYYLLVDPANHVLASTCYPASRAPLGEDVTMPVVWTRQHHASRVFYSSLGHDAATLSRPPILELTTRGLLWAAHTL